MLVTFYLSGPYSSTTVSSEFTIVGNPGAETFTGVTKTQLLAGHSLTFSESVTGGTVTTTEPETCVGTVVNWFVEPEPTPIPTETPTPTPTATPTVEYCYVGFGGVVYGPYSTLQECQQNAGSYICDQCVGEPEP